MAADCRVCFPPRPLTVADYTRLAFWMGAHLGASERAELGRYLNAQECAAYIGRTLTAVRRLVDRSEIPHVKVGRRVQFDRERIDAWMARHGKRGALVCS